MIVDVLCGHGGVTWYAPAGMTAEEYVKERQRINFYTWPSKNFTHAYEVPDDFQTPLIPVVWLTPGPLPMDTWGTRAELVPSLPGFINPDLNLVRAAVERGFGHLPIQEAVEADRAAVAEAAGSSLDPRAIEAVRYYGGTNWRARLSELAERWAHLKSLVAQGWTIQSTGQDSYLESPDNSQREPLNILEDEVQRLQQFS